MKRRDALGVLAVAGAALPAVRARAANPTITVAVGHSEPAAEVYFASENGFFDRADVPVKITVLANGAATTAALVSGAVQVASADIFVVARAQERGVPFVIVAPGALYEASRPSSMFVVAPNGPIRTPKDLEGKIVSAISLGGLEHLGQLAWLAEKHVDALTIKFLELPASEVVPSLLAGRIAGATLAEPLLSAERSRVRVLGQDLTAVAQRFLETAFAARSDWADANAALVRRFASALEAGGTWSAAHPEEAGAIIRGDLRIDVTRPHEGYASALAPDLIQPLLDAAFRFKLLDRAVAASSLIWLPPR